MSEKKMEQTKPEQIGDTRDDIAELVSLEGYGLINQASRQSV